MSECHGRGGQLRLVRCYARRNQSQDHLTLYPPLILTNINDGESGHERRIPLSATIGRRRSPSIQGLPSHHPEFWSTVRQTGITSVDQTDAGYAEEFFWSDGSLPTIARGTISFRSNL